MKEEFQEYEYEVIERNFTAEVALKLFALKLYFMELEDAKLLWKRLPTSHREAFPELKQLLLVCQAMIGQDFVTIHKILQDTVWSAHIEPIVSLLQEKVREKTLSLVSYAYTHISVQELAAMLSVSTAKLQEIVSSASWTIENGMVMPKATPQDSNLPARKEIVDLASLTRLVSYLEN
ncbi:COPS8 [Bugula neritina]|uniref:COP9 signalosome complex subunit 8 n=1 Tax=Bugula neritina TaxID=10212 RepID=A0A7J7KTB2_BUGNE|nr:COPS8 [Bugula neritina]